MMPEIAPVTEEMLPEIEEIEKRCFSDPWPRALLRHQMGRNNIFLAALSDGAVAGYIGLMHVLDEGHISNVAVREDFRRQGVAQLLIAALEERCREMRLSFMTLEVRRSNAQAIALYKECGFSEVGVRKNYYEKPREDAILMTKDLI